MVMAACMMATLLALAGCSVRDDESTPTAERVFTIVTPTPGTPGAERTDEKRPTSYTVKEGDNLSDIADQLGVSMQALQEANGIKDPDSIFAGQVLTVPTPEP
jgi:LysM repeat protein